MTDEHRYGLIENSVIAIENKKIAFVGNREELPIFNGYTEEYSFGGRLVTPGLIDCHTHLIYAGSRAQEFEHRLNGKSYEDIALDGGGIFSTVEATRHATTEELLISALRRLDRMIAEGVTTVEIKSGYGLNRETELRMLRVARSLAAKRPINISTTFLGAHAIPTNQNPDQYIDTVCIPTLREAANEGLVDAVDGFCEKIAFTPSQIERIFSAATELGLRVKLHAEQLSNSEGAALAAKHHALSADHLEYLSTNSIAAMADAGTVAVLLPAAFYALNETKVPPIAELRSAQIPIAIATDSNPGTAPITSLLLAMNMGATLFNLTPLECLKGVTKNAAKALGFKDRGTIEQGQRADLAVWDTTDPAELSYRIGDANLHCRYFEGKKY